MLLADVAAALADFHDGLTIAEQLGHFRPQTVVDVVAIHTLQAFDLLNVFELDEALFQLFDVLLQVFLSWHLRLLLSPFLRVASGGSCC
ncbi:hypothetical protein D3C86_1505830 [compost metagenome]